MTAILVDHNIAGYVAILSGTLHQKGWTELLELKLLTFQDVGLPINSSDREIWRYAQHYRMIFLTNNRNMKGRDSLEKTMREENKTDSLPIVTIGNVDRLQERNYREQCVTKLAEIVVDLNDNLGRGRIYIP